MTVTRDAAWQLLTEWTQSDSLRKHALAVEAAVRENHLSTVEQVTNYTKAGGGCGGCHEEIQEIITRVTGKPYEAPVQALRSPVDEGAGHPGRHHDGQARSLRQVLIEAEGEHQQGHDGEPLDHSGNPVSTRAIPLDTLTIATRTPSRIAAILFASGVDVETRLP